VFKLEAVEGQFYFISVFSSVSVICNFSRWNMWPGQLVFVTVSRHDQKLDIKLIVHWTYSC